MIMVSKLEMLKVNLMKIILLISSVSAFLLSYLTELTLNHIEQYLAVVMVIALDGYFGIWAGIKREGFKTFKAINVLKNIALWVCILTVILAVEVAFPGTWWLSETIIAPLLIFQLLSALKNAQMVGLIKSDVINVILKKVDPHKEYQSVEELKDDIKKIDRDDKTYDL